MTLQAEQLPDGIHGWLFLPVVMVYDLPLKKRPFELFREAHFYSEIAGRWITIPKSYRTDYFSIPRPWRWIFNRVGRGRNSALLHDWLCDSRPPWCDYKLAADIFEEAMQMSGVRSWRVKEYTWAVKRFGPRF